ncbi:HAD family hydrolase [Candidatus Thiothrix anitrata]|uniref:hypothetical protein n=1 Tax=Candidatus Thiothrix anitrata TaxID=2823902 RepID=UPI001D18BE4C|nr:hypothetical protein [Candidatus Thiothrix anitrata]
MAKLVVLHETPARLRVRLPALAERDFNPVGLESWLESQQGIKDVRINLKAASVAVDFDPTCTGRSAILTRLSAFRSSQVGEARGQSNSTVTDIAPLVSSAATLALMPFLTPAQRRTLSIADAAPTLLNGLDTFIHHGIEMEVLDALAIGLAGFKGEAYSASITTFLLALGEYLEHQTERKSDKLLRRLLQPEPAPAWVEREGELVKIPGTEVKVGEIVVVGIGETVPVNRQRGRRRCPAQSGSRDWRRFASTQGTTPSRRRRQRGGRRPHPHRSPAGRL